MDRYLEPQDLAFRDEVRAFLAAELPSEWCGRADTDSRIDMPLVVAWHKRLAARGWSVPAWPVEYGGTGWSPLHQHLFAVELARARAPKLWNVGTRLAGPVICAFGSDAMKRELLPSIINADDIWCQGFSEPGAGSDLASLRTVAVRQGGDYVIDGQKIWTTNAHLANRMFCLARTDMEAKPQAGISMIMLDMDTPGITIRPIRSIDGAHHLNEVFFDGVCVPAARLVGVENQGWSYAKFLLRHERTGIADLAATDRMLDDIFAALSLLDRTRAAEANEIRRQAARLRIRIAAASMLERRQIERDMQGEEDAAAPSMLKIIGSELRQAMTRLGMDLLGEDGGSETAARTALGGLLRHMPRDHLFYHAASIYGGANEVQRGMIARAALGQI